MQAKRFENTRGRAVGLVVESEARRALRQPKGRLERFGQSLRCVGTHLEAVDDRFDRVASPSIEFRLDVEFDQLAVDARTHVALAAQVIEHFGVFALAVMHDRSQQQHARAFRQREHVVDHLRDGLRGQVLPVLGAARHAGPREQHAQVVVDFGDGADGRTRIVRRRLLFDGDGRGQALDVVDVRLLHDGEELACVGRERLDVAALSLRVDRVERKRRLARARQPGDDDQAVAGQVEVDVAQVVGARAADADDVHSARLSGCREAAC